MDQADWDEALFNIHHCAADMEILGRLLGVRVQEHLSAWRASGEEQEGALAADALDQALGLLQELAGGRAEGLADLVQSLLDILPPSLQD